MKQLMLMIHKPKKMLNLITKKMIISTSPHKILQYTIHKMVGDIVGNKESVTIENIIDIVSTDPPKKVEDITVTI